MKTKNNFQFYGFVPDKNVQEKMQFVYNLIESRAPSDSKKEASLTKKGDIYEARLKVSSAGDCSFEIFSKKDSLSDSIEGLQKKFFDKIINWNKTRDQNAVL